MSNKNIFIALFSVLITLVLVFQFLIYLPKDDEKEQLKADLKLTANKFNTAKLAEKDLENIRLKLHEQEKKLEAIKGKFIYKNQLRDITGRMQQITKGYNLRIADFTPELQSSFSDTSTVSAGPLPFSITVSGKYMDIGKYLESWSDLEFYIMHEEIFIRKKNPKQNILEAEIIGNLYAWSKGRD